MVVSHSAELSALLRPQTSVLCPAPSIHLLHPSVGLQRGVAGVQSPNRWVSLDMTSETRNINYEYAFTPSS